MEAFVSSLVERVPNKDTFFSMGGKLSLVRAKVMDKRGAPKHPERNIKSKACGRVEGFEALKRGLEVEHTGRHPIYKVGCSQNCIPPQV